MPIDLFVFDIRNRRSAELLGLIPLVLCADRSVKSDAEVIRQMGFEGF